jgi:hypothetical protein
MSNSRTYRRPIRTDEDTITEVDLNNRGYPGEVQKIATVVNSTNITLSGGPAQTNSIVGLFIRIAPKTSFETGTLNDAQDRIVTAYDKDTKQITVNRSFDPLPDLGDGDWTAVVIGRGGILEDPPAGGENNQIILPAEFNGADVDSFTGTTVYFHTGGLEDSTFIVTAYNKTGDTVTLTLTPPWSIDDLPDVGDVFSIHGERVTAVPMSDGRLSLISPIHSDTQGGANSFSNSYRQLTAEIVGVSSAENTSNLGKIAQITQSYNGTITLSEPFNLTTYGEQIALLIFGGWISPYASTGNNSYALMQLSVASGEYGIRYIMQSPTLNGYNKRGISVAHREMMNWGVPPNQDIFTGISMESGLVIGAYYQIRLLCFSPTITGAFHMRFASTGSLASAQVDSVANGLSLTNATFTSSNDEEELTAEDIATATGTAIGNILPTDTNGALRVNTPASAFGDARVVPLTPQVQINFSEIVSEQELIKSSTTGSIYTVRQGYNQIYACLGDKPFGETTVAANAFATAQSKQICRYRPGEASLARFSAVFHGPVVNLSQTIGLASLGNRLEFGYSNDGDPAESKFGINRATGGRVEVRSLQIVLVNTPLDTSEAVALTTPSMDLAGGVTLPSYTFEVIVPQGVVNASRVAHYIANKSVDSGDGSSSPNQRGWNFQSVGDNIIIHSLNIGTCTGDFDFADASNGSKISTNPLSSQQKGVDGHTKEIRELYIRLVDESIPVTDIDITLPRPGADDIVATITINVNENEATGAATAGDIAWLIVNKSGTTWDPANVDAAWKAEIIGDFGSSRIRFTALEPGELNGTYAATSDSIGVILDPFIQQTAAQPIVNNWVFQEAWNIDTCDGNGPSKFTLNPQNGNVYQIEYEYLGYGCITFYIESTTTPTSFIPVHKIIYPGTSITPSLEGPHMRLQMSVCASEDIPLTGVGNLTLPLQIASGSWAFFTQGPIVHLNPKFTVNNSIEADSITVGERRALIFLKHPEIYNNKPSLISVVLQEINVGLNGATNKPSIIEAVLNPIYTAAEGASVAATGEPLWRYVQFAESPVLVATTMTNVKTGEAPLLEPIEFMLVTGGTPIASAGISGVSAG